MPPGPICRTVDDIARLLDVIAGFDSEDETTAIHVKWMAEKIRKRGGGL